MYDVMMRFGITDASQLTQHRLRNDLDWNRIHAILRAEDLLIVLLVQHKAWYGFVWNVDVCNVARRLHITDTAVRRRMERLAAELDLALNDVFNNETCSP
jgi:hypothetical protein